MGNCIRAVFKKLRRKSISEKTIVLLLVGLDNAGKTLVLNRITGDADHNVLPTIGFRTVSLKYKSYNIKVYDLGGSPQIRPIWSKYYNDVHGLIYVVDASDLSRLTENRIILGDLISHEHVSGKPLLLLANKQDLTGAVDELDLVESLDVEHVANAMRCPTRVETCSCVRSDASSRKNTHGIINGYKWLLNTILKNYTTINTRIREREEQTRVIGFLEGSKSSPTPSKASIHSDPFKPIHELLVPKEDSSGKINVQNADAENGKTTFKKFLASCKNKTAPLSLGQRLSKSQHTLHRTDCDFALFEAKVQAAPVVTLEPLRLQDLPTSSRPRPIRPFTAPQHFQKMSDKLSVVEISDRRPE